MDYLERLVFYKDFKENKNAEHLDMTKVIKYPQNIYRYRTINSNSLSALIENKLYFSNSNYYDDPFDTNIYVDEKINKINK
mgnify:CR=1 FL=1|jgi:hypothetical protein